MAGFGRSNPDMLSIGAIPDEMLDAIINGAFDRAYKGEDVIPGDAELFRQGGFDPSVGGQRRVAHRQDWVRDELDGGDEGMRGRMESRWRTPDDTSLDEIMSRLEGGGEPSMNDNMLLDMMKVDGFGDGQGQLMDRFDDLKSNRFGFSEEAGDWDDEPGWPSTTRGDPRVGRPGPQSPSMEDLVQAMMGARSGPNNAGPTAETVSPRQANLWEIMRMHDPEEDPMYRDYEPDGDADD